jgi:hypothetical protein
MMAVSENTYSELMTTWPSPCVRGWVSVAGLTDLRVNRRIRFTVYGGRASAAFLNLHRDVGLSVRLAQKPDEVLFRGVEHPRAGVNGIVCPRYLELSFAGDFGVTGCEGRKVELAWTGLLPPFGFFASRFHPPRPLATEILLIVQIIVSSAKSARSD